MSDSTQDDAIEKYLAFSLHNKVFAMPISYVKEIMEYVEVDLIPLAPEFIIGAIDLRGDVIPVADLSVRLAHVSQPITNRTCIIITEITLNERTFTVGFKVDVVTKVLDIQHSEIDSVPTIAGQFESRFVCGLARIEGRLLALLDVNKMLTLTDLDRVRDMSFPDLQIAKEEGKE